MTFTPRSIVACACLAAAVAVAWSGTSAARARGEAQAANAAFEIARAGAAEVISLRATRPTIAVGKRPEPGIYRQFTDALIEAGVPVTALTSLTPDADSSVTIEGAGSCKRQSVRATLEGLTLPQFGRALAAWRRAQPDWTMMQIQLTPQPTKEPSAGGAAIARTLRVTLVMEATYLDQPGIAPP